MRPSDVRRWAGAIGALALFAVAPVWAAPITVNNHSFENQVANLNAGGWTNQLVDWVGTNGTNDGNAFEEYIVGFVAQGTDHLGMALNYDVWQDVGLSYQANSVYTLTVATGNRSGNTVAGNQSTYILADDTATVYATGVKDASTQPLNTFQDAPALVFDTATNPAAVGKPIRILLRARGAGRSHWDNIRLDGPTDTRATVTTSAATNITSGSAQLNGTVTNIGSGAPSITLYYGPSDGGSSKTAWASNIALPGTHTGAFSQAISGLNGNLTYFYRALATNPSGERWSTPATSFVTPAGPPSLDNLAATGITPSAARLGVTVLATGGDAPAVTMYYGPVDGGTTPGNWASSKSLGAVNTSAFGDVSSLSENTTYFFRAFGQNSVGSAWAPATASFTTADASLPGVVNRAPTNITHHSATLRGTVTATGGDPPMATIYWGTTDGGTNSGAWQNAAPQGHQANDFSEDAVRLLPGTTYYYRSAAANGAGTAWAGSSVSFTTPSFSAPSLVNDDANGITATTATLRGMITNDGGYPGHHHVLLGNGRRRDDPGCVAADRTGRRAERRLHPLHQRTLAQHNVLFPRLRGEFDRPGLGAGHDQFHDANKWAVRSRHQRNSLPAS